MGPYPSLLRGSTSSLSFVTYPRLSSNQISTHDHAKQTGGSLKTIMTNTHEGAGPLGTSQGKLAQRVP